MRKTAKKSIKTEGWTIVELLTVMSIIVLLISMLVPALNRVRRFAKDVSQHAQFHAINTAMELFYGENESYPPSDRKEFNSLYTCGAHHLAEALLGRDLQGFDPRSNWNAGLDFTTYADTIYPQNQASPEYQKSLERRKGPYLSIGRVDTISIFDLYDEINGSVVDLQRLAPVITDVYQIKRTRSEGKQVKRGTPVLYYKANTNATGWWDLTAPQSNVFNYDDNRDIVALGTIMNPATSTNPVLHRFDSAETHTPHGPDVFYYQITIPQTYQGEPGAETIVPGGRPFNPDSYILISAGYDGIYGTADDIHNFGE